MTALPRPLLLAALLVCSPAAPAQEKGEKLCGDCKTTGKIAHEHKADVLEREKDVLYCSYWMDHDPEALCLDWVPCPDCLTPSVKAAAEREFGGEIAKRKAWLEKRREEVDKVARTECIHIETEHFILSWDIPKIKVGRKTVRMHDAAHLYAERAEELYRYIIDLHQIDEPAQMIGTKFKFAMFERKLPAINLAPSFVDKPIQGGQKVQIIGPHRSNMVSWDDPEKILGDDEHRHQFFVHSVSHHIYHDIQLGKIYQYWLFKRYGWMYEGLAFYLEHRLFGPPKLTCSQESAGFSQYREKSWEALVKKEFQGGEYPSFPEVSRKGADTLNDEERWMSWSYVDYLMWLDPTKMPKLVSLMTNDQLETRDALKEAYGITMGQFMDGWADFVRREYSLRPKKGPIVRPPRGSGR